MAVSCEMQEWAKQVESSCAVLTVKHEGGGVMV